MDIIKQEVNDCMFARGGLTKGSTELYVRLTTDAVGYVIFLSRFNGKGLPDVTVADINMTDDGTMPFTAPVDFDKWQPNQQHIFSKYVERGEKAFQMLLATGMQLKQAKAVIPSAITHHVTLAGTFVQWTNFFLLCKCPFVRKFLVPVEKILLENHEDYFGKVFKK